MTLVSMKYLLETAQKNNFAIGYFEAWDTYSLEAVAIAAEKEKSPIVLGFGGLTVNQSWLDKFGIESLGTYAKKLAESLKVPAAVYLNEVFEIDQIKRGISSGFNSVLLDSSHLPYQKNIEVTKSVVSFAHNNNAHVQGELGSLPNFKMNDDKKNLTNPVLAKEFIEQTNIDFLGVSIGNVHLHSKGKYKININLLNEINNNVKIPLVIHGTTGFPINQISNAINNGVSMFQVGTILKNTFYFAVKNFIQNTELNFDIHQYVGSRKKTDFLEFGKEKIIILICEYINLFNSKNKSYLYE